MPYIKESVRNDLQSVTSAIEKTPALSPGELNYLITQCVKAFLGPAVPTYHVLNEAMGVLECAKLEFYARVVRPYEDTKIKENGDVYP